MKKIMGLFIFVIISVFLVACDYSEKSFQAFDYNLMPNKVTEDFHLQKGKYSKFEWSSDNEAVISIVDNKAIVTCQEEDVLVTLTAKINHIQRNFNVLVLKIGSEKSSYERTMEIVNGFKEAIVVDKNGKLLAKIIDKVYIKYNIYPVFGENRYQIEEKEEGIFLTSLVPENQSFKMTFNIVFYEDDLMTEELYQYAITVKFI